MNNYLFFKGGLLLLIHLLILNSLLGQQYTYKNYSIDDGLPSNTIYKIDQDSKGYLWISTGSGASRFNGSTFYNINNKNGLSENIFGLKIDKYDRVWFDTYNSYLVYFENDSIYKTNEIKYLNAQNIKNNHSFKIDSSIITACQQDCTIVKLNLDDFSLIEIQKPQREEYIEFLFRCRLDLKDYDSFVNKFVCDFKGKKEKKIGKGIYLFPSTSDHVWLRNIGKKGIFYCRIEEDCVIPEQHFFPEYLMNSAFEDRYGNTWFGSQNNGLFLLSYTRFKSLTTKQGLESNGLYAVAQDDKKQIWVGTDNGYVNIINPNDLKVSGIHLPINAFQVMDLESHKNQMWVQTAKSSIYLFEDGKHKADFISENAFNKDLFIDEASNVWGGGTFCFDRVFVDNKKNKIIHSDNQSDCLFKNKTFASYVGKDTAYIGTNIGLYKLIFSEKDTVSIYYGDKNKDLLYGIRDIERYNGKLWIATVSSGLVVFDCASEETILISSDTHPLGNDACRELFIDKKKEAIWVATNNGVTKIGNIKDLENLTFKVYNSNDGLINNEATDVMVDEKGTTWVTTKKGLTFFNESDFDGLSSSPQIFINAVQIWGQDTTVQEKYILEKSENDISISVEGLDFNSIISYKYKLEGRDEDWVIGKEHKIRYSKLPIGVYSFSVYAVNEDGIESETAAQLKFVIERPFWMTYWSALLIGLLFALAIYLIFSWRISVLKRQNEMAKLSLKGLGSQMNSHFLFNSLNSIQNFLLDNEVESAHRYLTKFSRLIRKTLHYSSKETISIEDEINVLETYLDLETMRMNDKIVYNFDIDEKIDRNRMKIQPMLLQPYIENSIRWGLKDINYQGKISIKFTLENERQLKCVIEDNGIGRKKAQEIKSKYFVDHESFSTKLNENRIKLLSASQKRNFGIKIIDLYDDQNHSSGTKVEILLPI